MTGVQPVTMFIARSSAVIAALLALVVTVVGAATEPGHSHVANYISELGARGTAHGELVSLGGFLPIGIAAFVALIASARLEPNRRLRTSIGWMMVLPLAYVTAAFARCTERCAGMDGAQFLHNLAGMAEYLGGAIALAIAGAALWRSGRKSLSAALWLSSVAVFIFMGYLGQPLFEFRGAAQRLAETLLFGFLLFLAWHGRPSSVE